MRLLPCSEAHTDVEQQQFQGATRNGTNGPTCLDGRPLTQMAHCFAHPDTSHSVFTGTAGCAAGRQLLDSFSACNISPFTLRNTTADVPVAYDMADQSPFASLLRTSLQEESSLPPGHCCPPDAALPAAHVQRVILPRIQALLSPTATLVTSSFTTATTPAATPSVLSPQSSAAPEQSPPEDYPEHHQLNDIMHVIQQHAANPFAMKENATALTEELRAMLRIASSSAPTLGPTPDATTNPGQFICACLHRANLLFILADLLFLEHASVNPETGFGLANTPTSAAPNAACVREAEGLVVESLALHDKAMQSYRDFVEARSSSSSPRVSVGAQVPSLTGTSSGESSSAASDSEPCVCATAACDLEPELRSSRFVQPRSKVMLRFALIQAALGKREQAVERLHEIASLDPWIPELELRPPEVAHAHRVSVEQAKSGLVWYYNSSHDSLKANRYRDDAMLWKMHRMSQEVNSQWEPADLLPHRSQAIAPHAPVSAGQTTDLRAARAAAMAAAAAGGSDDQRSRSAPLLRHAQHFRAPAPARDPQAGKCPPEQHMLKLLRDAQEAGDKELTISILARAIEHGAATSDVASPTVLEPLIEHSYHVVSAANPSCTTTNSTAVRLLQHALTLLRDPASVGAAAPAGAEAAARLRLRRRAVHALATALHQSNRVSEPLALHRRALAHALHNAGDAESAATLEPRVHIAALSVVRLYMLSEAGAEDLARVADRPDCCEGSWKTLYGRGRPGQLNRFFQPVVERDNSAEINNITRWLHQHLQMGVRILTLHLLRLAHAAADRLQNLPEPSLASSHFPPRLTSPLPSRTPSSANLPLIHEAVGETESANSQWGGDTDDLGISSSTDNATGVPTDDIVSDAEAPSAASSRHGIFRNVSQRSRLLKVGLGRSSASYALLAAVEEDSKNWSVEDLVLLLKNTCEEADTLAREAQTQRGFAVTQPPWVAHLCMPHWKVVLTLLSSHLTLATPTNPPSAPTLEQLTANLSRVLEIYSEYFCTSDSCNDGDSDTLFSLNLSTSHQNTVTSPSPLGGAPIRPAASEAVVSGHATASSAAASVPRSSLSAFSNTGTSSASSSPVLGYGGATDAPLNVYMPPDNLHGSGVPASPLKQAPAISASAAVGTSSAVLATTEMSEKKHLQGLSQALCLRVNCKCASAHPANDCGGGAGHAAASSSGGAQPVDRIRSSRCTGDASSGCGGAHCSSAVDAFMSAFDLSASQHLHPVQPRQESELHHMFARMYNIVDYGVGDDTTDTEDTADSSVSPAAVLYLYPKMVSNLPLPKPAQHVQHAYNAQHPGHTSPTSTAMTSPTPQSSLRLTYRSGSLSVSLPATEAGSAVTRLVPKPTVESFGLEPDESTSISLGSTPIPCMLAVCFGTDGASSSASASPTSSTAGMRSYAADSQAAVHDSCPATEAHNASAAPLGSTEESSSAVDAHPVLSHAVLPESAAAAHAGNDGPSAAAGSPPGSFPSLTAPQLPSHAFAETAHASSACAQSTPVAIPPQSVEGHEHHAHPFYPSSYPQGTSPSYEVSTGGSFSVVPFAPCSHIFGAGGTSLCTAALSDPMCSAAALSPPQSSVPTGDQSAGSLRPRGELGSIAKRDMRASEQREPTAREAQGAVPLKGNTFGSDEFNAEAFNAVPSELRGTFCRSPPMATLQAVSAPVLVSAYSCWHTPHNEHDCEFFGDSGSPSSANDGDEGAFGSVCEPTAPGTRRPSPLRPPRSMTNQHQLAPKVRSNDSNDDSGDDSDDDVIGSPGTSLQSEVPALQSPPVPQYLPQVLSLDSPPTSDPSLPQARSAGSAGGRNQAPQLRTLMPPAATDTSSASSSTGAASMPSLPTLISRSYLPGGQNMAESANRDCSHGAIAAPYRPPSPGMPPFGGTAGADCFMPAPSAHAFARPWGTQGAPPPKQGAAQERASTGGLERTGSPPRMFRPPRPPSPCVDASGHKRVSQSNPGFGGESDGDCGVLLSRSGESAGDPAACVRPPVAGSSAPLLRAVDSQGGGAFGGLLWGREGPGSAAGHMRARSVCLDNLDL